MTTRIARLFFTFFSLLSLNCFAALGEADYIEHSPGSRSLELVGTNKAQLYISEQDWKGVARALSDLQHDTEKVTGQRPTLISDSSLLSGHSVIVGTIGRSPLIDQLIKDELIDPSAILDKWDGYHMQLVEKPLPNVERALVIAGANKRGTIYGIYDISEQIGVSPWYYWADIPVAQHKSLYVKEGTFIQDYARVKYRGIFLNDEAPALSSWVEKNHGNYTHEFYEKVFELMLRLKANFLWPAMWNNAFADDDPQNMILADEYGIVMSTSHHEPMMRADKEWNRYGEGPWEYSTNPKNLSQFWRDGAIRNKDYESIYTMGMRGQEDKPMSEGENIGLLEDIVAEQRKILEEVFDDRPITEVPQVWALYKEVQGFYERGMRVPEDVILLWADDNWGNIRRLPTPDERGRLGGAGVYYHFDYVGGPRSYRWINTIPIAKIWEQMHLAWKFEANQIWITNVGDLKPMEYPTEFFLRMAWDPERWPRERVAEFGEIWAEREFGAEYAEEIEALINGYTRHNGRRKPELMEPATYSILHYDEAARIEAELDDLVARAETLYQSMPPQHKDAFFQLVLHPVKASAIVTKLNIAVARNRHFASQGRANANDFAAQARALFAADAALKEQYHSINDGKWEHFMNQSHIGYLSWNNPEADQMPVTYDYSPGDYAEMGVAVEGSVAGWPQSGRFELRFDQAGKSSRWIEIYNRGTQAFNFKAKPSDDWIKLSATQGEVETAQRVQVEIDWRKLKAGQHRGTISIRGTGWAGSTVTIHALKHEKKALRKAKGFIEADGYIAIEAANFSRKQEREGIAWQEVPLHGRTQSSMSTYPITDKSFEELASGPYLEYDVTFLKAGEVRIDAILAPSWPIVPGRGLRYAVAIGDEEPKVVDFLSGMKGTDSGWADSVRDGVRVGSSTHTVKQAGSTTLRFYMIDSAVTLQRIHVDSGGLLPSYLGPEQSKRR
jgi:hypothetical protein